MKKLLVLAAFLALAGCSASQNATVATDLAQAKSDCAIASAVAPVVQVGSQTKAQVAAGCTVINAIPAAP